jgi:hypothetical protein
MFWLVLVGLFGSVGGASRCAEESCVPGSTDDEAQALLTVRRSENLAPSRHDDSTEALVRRSENLAPSRHDDSTEALALNLSDVAMWVHTCVASQNQNDTFVGLPAVQTLRHALSSFGAHFIETYTRDASDSLPELLRRADRLAKSSQLWMVLLFPQVCIGDLDAKLVSHVSSAAARTVLYWSEPNAYFYTSGEIDTHVRRFGAHEVWHYSKRNMELLSRLSNASAVQRFFPPGYSPGLDFGVQQGGEDPGLALGFMGDFNQRREQALRTLSLTAARLQNRSDIYTVEGMASMLTRVPLQLNLHREWFAPETQPMEAFRVAVLLSNRACVLSEPADPADEEFWRDLVTFTRGHTTPWLVETLRNDLAGCRSRSYERFRRRFAAPRLFRDSGALEEVFRIRAHRAQATRGPL